MTIDIDGDIKCLTGMVMNVLERYDLAVLMEGSIPLVTFERGLEPEKMEVVLNEFTRKGSTYWVDGVMQEDLM